MINLLLPTIDSSVLAPIEHLINRTTLKKTIMTLPYGVGESSSFNYFISMVEKTAPVSIDDSLRAQLKTFHKLFYSAAINLENFLFNKTMLSYMPTIADEVKKTNADGFIFEFDGYKISYLYLKTGYVTQRRVTYLGKTDKYQINTYRVGVYSNASVNDTAWVQRGV